MDPGIGMATSAAGQDFTWLSDPPIVFAGSFEWIDTKGKQRGELFLRGLNRTQAAATPCKQRGASEPKLKEILIAACGPIVVVNVWRPGRDGVVHAKLHALGDCRWQQMAVGVDHDHLPEQCDLSVWGKLRETQVE